MPKPKFSVTIEYIRKKYPKFNSDLIKYEKQVVIESLEWRIENPTSVNFSCRVEVISKYFPYLNHEETRRVQCHIRKNFYSIKSDPVFDKYRHMPELSRIFSKTKDQSNTLEEFFNSDDHIDNDANEEFKYPKNMIVIAYNNSKYEAEIQSMEHFNSTVCAVSKLI